MRLGYAKRIGKNTHIVFSTKGISCRIGGENFGFHISSNGINPTIRIPGTNIHLTSSKKKVKKVKRPYNPNVPHGKYTFNYHDDATFTFYDALNREVTNTNLITNIKKSEQFHAEVKRINKERLDAEKATLDDYIHIEKHATPILSKQELLDSINQLSIKKYQKKVFSKPCPSKQEVQDILIKEAKKNISPWQIFSKNKIIQEYLNTHLETRYQELYTKYQTEKAQFDLLESKKAAAHSLLESAKLLLVKHQLQLLMQNDIDTITSQIDSWLESVAFPFEFTLSYQVIYDRIYVDLDLPEIEMLPQDYYYVLATGLIKKKKKTIAQLNQEYIQCVSGLALFFATHLFSLAIGINEIIISGYTQRLLKDEYIYSICFDRDSLSKYKKFNDSFVIYDFKHVANISPNYKMKKIIPFPMNK